MFRKVIEILKERPLYKTIETLVTFDKRVAKGFQQGIAEARGEAIRMKKINLYQRKTRARVTVVRRVQILVSWLSRRLGMARRRISNFEPNLILYGLKRDGSEE